MSSRIASLHAVWQISLRSAPLNLSVFFARYDKFTSFDIGELRRVAFKQALTHNQALGSVQDVGTNKEYRLSESAANIMQVKAADTQ